MSNNEIIEKVIQDFHEIKRKHADFFHAPREFKGVKEHRAANKLCDFLKDAEKRSYKEISQGGDPPDIQALTESGEECAIEVTELVNQKAIESQINNDGDYFSHLMDWDEKKFINRLKSRISRKENDIPRYKKTYDKKNFIDTHR